MSLNSGKRCNKVVFVYDLPYTERKSLCNILDMNDQWERLGGEKMGFSVIELNEIKRSERCGESPTDRLLHLWGMKNNTVLSLYHLLYDIEHFQAMSILQPFITEEYYIDKVNDEIADIKIQDKNLHTMPPANLLIDMKAAAKGATSTLSCKQTNISHALDVAENPNFNQLPSRPQAAYSDSDNKVPDHFLGGATCQMREESLKVEGTLNFISNLPVIKSQTKSPSDKILNTQNMKSPVGSQRRHQSMVSNISNLSECGVPMIPFDELEDATSNWCKQHFLGNGGFGSVYKGTWINVQVAIKRINKTAQNDSAQNITQTLDELKYLLRFRHDNILQVYGFSADDGKPLCLVYQFMPNGSLEYRLQCKKIEGFGEKAPKPLTWYERFQVAKGTAAALEFLHTVQDKPLIHGDVKSANILLDKNLDPKLGDFGLAREGPQSQYTSMQVSHVHGTRPYIPEEYLRSKKLSTKVDTYSYGIVLFEICTGCKAYHEKSKKYLKDQVLEVRDPYSLKDTKGGPDNINVFSTLFEIGLECINKSPKYRPDMTKTFQKLNWFAKALSQEEHKNFVIEPPKGSSSVAPLTIQAWQDTIASHLTSPSTFQSDALFLHPSRVPASHHHQLNHLAVPPNSHPYSIQASSNPPRSPVPHLISSTGIPISLTHGWFKGLSVNAQSTGGGNIYSYTPSTHLPSGIGPDHLNIRNTNIESKSIISENSVEEHSVVSDGFGIMGPLPDLSRLMLQSSHVNIESSDQSSSSGSDIEESSFSQKSYDLEDDGAHLSSDLLKSFSSKENKKDMNTSSIIQTGANAIPSSVGKIFLLD